MPSDIDKMNEHIRYLENEVAALKKLVNQQPTPPKSFERWHPKPTEDVWYLNHYGIIQAHRGGCWPESFKRGTLYRTKEEADRADRIRVAKRRVLDIILKHNEGWVPDWSNTDAKYSFYLTGTSVRVNIEQSYEIRQQPNEYFMKSKVIALNVIKEVGDDIYSLFDLEKCDVK